MKAKWFVVAMICVILITLVGVADNAYPRGVVYKAATEASSAKITPSPSYNPGWVRFFQNNDWIVYPTGIGLLIFLYLTWEEKAKHKKEHED